MLILMAKPGLQVQWSLKGNLYAEVGSRGRLPHSGWKNVFSSISN